MEEQNQSGREHFGKRDYETTKAFDESMATLLEWLNLAMAHGYLAEKRAFEIFGQELEKRGGYKRES